jgi:5'-nucleotidase
VDIPTPFARTYHLQNVDNKNVIVNQVGWAGLKLGRIDFIFNAINNQLTLQKHQAIHISSIA